MYCVYAHINKINQKMYIGITSNIKRRWQNKGEQYKSSPVFYNAIKKYGWDNFYHVILQENLSKEDACEFEKRLIKKYKNCLYNISDGGDSGPALFAELNPNYNKVRTKTHCDNLSNSLKGHTTSEETKQKISDNNAMKRSIKCVESNMEFSSISEAAKYYHTYIQNIWRVVSGKRTSWHKNHFIYSDIA